VRHAAADHGGHRARECEQHNEFRAGQIVGPERQIAGQIGHDEPHAHRYDHGATRRLGEAQPGGRQRVGDPIVAARRYCGAEHKAEQDQRQVTLGGGKGVNLAHMEQKADAARRRRGDQAVDDISEKARRLAWRAAEKCVTLQQPDRQADGSQPHHGDLGGQHQRARLLRSGHQSAEELRGDEQIDEYAEGQEGQAVDRKSREVHRFGRVEAALPQTAHDTRLASLRSQHRASQEQG